MIEYKGTAAREDFKANTERMNAVTKAIEAKITAELGKAGIDTKNKEMITRAATQILSVMMLQPQLGAATTVTGYR